jgi:hypothetical protein
VLKALLRRKVDDPDGLGPADLLIDPSNPQEPVQEWFPGDDRFAVAERRRGLPLGNQTSRLRRALAGRMHRVLTREVRVRHQVHLPAGAQQSNVEELQEARLTQDGPVNGQGNSIMDSPPTMTSSPAGT